MKIKQAFLLNNLEYIDENEILSLVERIKNKYFSYIEEEPEKLFPDSLLPIKNPTINSLSFLFSYMFFNILI